VHLYHQLTTTTVQRGSQALMMEKPDPGQGCWGDFFWGC